jgi:hypothetical protein
MTDTQALSAAPTAADPFAGICRHRDAHLFPDL